MTDSDGGITSPFGGLAIVVARTSGLFLAVLLLANLGRRTIVVGQAGHTSFADGVASALGQGTIVIVFALARFFARVVDATESDTAIAILSAFPSTGVVGGAVAE